MTNPGRNDLQIIRAHRLLTSLEPHATPPLALIHVSELPPDIEGVAAGGVISVNRHGSYYRRATVGDHFALAQLLHHEHQHAAYNADELTALEASYRFCRKHHADAALTHEILYDLTRERDRRRADQLTETQEKPMYQPRFTSDGTPCCSRTLDDGRLAYGLRTASGALAVCEPCRHHHRAAALRLAQESHMSDYTSPNPYAPDLAKLMTAEQKEVATLKAAAFRAIDAAAADVAAENAARFRAMAADADDLASYAPPDGYAFALKASRR
jgi:hypothetical protein